MGTIGPARSSSAMNRPQMSWRRRVPARKPFAQSLPGATPSASSSRSGRKTSSSSSRWFTSFQCRMIRSVNRRASRIVSKTRSPASVAPACTTGRNSLGMTRSGQHAKAAQKPSSASILPICPPSNAGEHGAELGQLAVAQRVEILGHVFLTVFAIFPWISRWYPCREEAGWFGRRMGWRRPHARARPTGDPDLFEKGPRRLRAPFTDLAGLVLDARPRHAHRRRAERAREPALAPTVAVAFAGTAAAAPVAAAPEEGFELLLEQRLDGGADVPPQPILDRVVVDVDRRWRARVGAGNLAHGVISLAVPAADWVGFRSPGDDAALPFPPPSRHDQVRPPSPHPRRIYGTGP